MEVEVPVYSYKCEKCDKIEDAYRKIDDRKNSPLCCDEKMKQIITAFHVIPDLEPYLDEHIGSKPTWVKSKKHRRQLMKENGVMEIG